MVWARAAAPFALLDAVAAAVAACGGLDLAQVKVVVVVIAVVVVAVVVVTVIVVVAVVG